MDALKILVVDDESRMRKLVKDFLSKKNFQVLLPGKGHRPYHPGCDDAQDGRLGSMQGNPEEFQGSHHHAYRKRR